MVYTLISLVCLFGGSGCPGEWMVNAYAGKVYHGVGYPARPEWHDDVGFHSHYLMDDQIFQEVSIGRRAFMSM